MNALIFRLAKALDDLGHRLGAGRRWPFGRVCDWVDRQYGAPT